MKKRLLSFMTVLVLTFSVCMTAFATEGEITDEPVPRQGTAAELKSYGAIVYQKGTNSIRIDSDDLYMLADQIDQVKLDVNDQLAALNTYFTAGEGMSLNTTEDINVVHAEPVKEDSIDPLTVNFDTLLEGIAVSQTVPQDVTAYGFADGTEFYKNTNGTLTTDGSEKGAEKISVTAATADNLSAGTAAWVNGSLILGTGEDNKSYSESGYSTGYTKGYNEGQKAGAIRVINAERVDDTSGNKKGVNLYVGNHQYFFMVGTNNFSFSPAPIDSYSGHSAIFFRVDASSNGGYINFPYYGTPVVLYYLSTQ